MVFCEPPPSVLDCVRSFNEFIHNCTIVVMGEYTGLQFTVPVQAYAFLGAVVGFLVLLVVFFLYLNKRLCFSQIGGFPCCDEPVKKKEPKSKELGSAYAYDDNESSSDSEDEVLKRLQMSMSNQSIRKAPSTRSIHSTKSNASQEQQISPAEPEEIVKPSVNKDLRSSKKEKETKPETEDLISLAEQGHVITSGEDLDAAVNHIPQHTYDNEAFRKSDDEESPARSDRVLSAYGDSVGDQDEHLFDISDLQHNFTDQEPHLISKCGSLEVSFYYDAPARKMTITVIQARDIPTKERGGANHTQVRLLLLPAKKQKFKTKVRSGENPEFIEGFTFTRVNPEDVNSMGVRFRLYGCERMRRERMIGESVVGFASLNLDTETTHWLTLEPRSNLAHADSKTDVASLTRSDSTGSTQSMQHGGVPELLIGLAYNGTTGRLSVEVIKGSHFRNMAMNRAPDTYVKLSLMSSNGQEIARSRTSIRRGQPNPLYKETFMFQVALFQLPDVTLMISVYNKRSMKRKEMIGWFSLGLNNSGEEELSHWNDMRESKGDQVCRWHVLLES